MDRFPQPQIMSRQRGPAPGAPGDGLAQGMPYTAVIQSAPSAGQVQVTIPALHLSQSFHAYVQPGLAPVVGETCLILFDEGKQPWVIAFTGVASTAALEVTRVTLLPASPVDGQTVDYVADATNGVVWRLRYRTASASAHKWEFVGGSGIRTAPLGDITTASVAFVALTGGPTITVPLAGAYEITLSIEMVNKSGAGNNMLASIFLEAVEQIGTTIIAGKEETGGVVTAESTIAAGAGEALSVKVRSANAGSSRYVNARLSMRPVRVG